MVSLAVTGLAASDAVVSECQKKVAVAAIQSDFFVCFFTVVYTEESVHV